MRAAKVFLLWMVRAVLALLVFLELFLGFYIIENYRRAGIDGVRDFVSFHMKPVGEFRYHSAEELVREAQRGYEFFAVLVVVLVALTWLGFRADKWIRDWMRHDGTRVTAGESSKESHLA